MEQGHQDKVQPTAVNWKCTPQRIQAHDITFRKVPSIYEYYT